jgi:hypothetical protein
MGPGGASRWTVDADGGRDDWSCSAQKHFQSRADTISGEDVSGYVKRDPDTTEGRATL